MYTETNKYSELIDGIAAKQHELLSKEEVVSVVWDNHQKTRMRLQDQRGQSSRSLLGTHEAELRVWSYDKTQFDDHGKRNN